jgi:predicted transcriptional regulator
VLRTPVVTARDLADELSITPQAALGLLRQLIAAGVVREATGRAAWRAFTTA